jgi:peptidyl-prolyl cis-trans isomerase SDCCAG10
VINDKFSWPDKVAKAGQDLAMIRERHTQAASKTICNGISIRFTGHSHSRQIEIEIMEADIRKLARKRDGDDSDNAPTNKSENKSHLEEMAKYAKYPGSEYEWEDKR